MDRVEDGVKLGENGFPRSYGSGYMSITQDQYELMRERLHKLGHGR